MCVFLLSFFPLLIGPVVLVHKFTPTNDKYAYPFVIVVVALSLLARILGECSIIHSPPVCFLFFFKWRLVHAHHFHSLGQDQSHSGSAS